MVSVADIKKELPAWPDEIIDDWLLYFANEPDCGWPPPDPFDGHRWSGILGGRPISWWKNVTWEKCSVSCNLEHLAPKTREIASNMLDEIMRQTADDVTKRRYQQAFQHILETGGFFRPLVAMETPTELLVLDGNHRVTAFCGLQILPEAWYAKLNKKRPPLQQDAWVGSHTAGELPLS
jgi:hypothetical protein